MNALERIIVADHTASLSEVLRHLGYDIYKIPMQISCPVHKFGVEARKSARIYEDDLALWCFKCAQRYRSTEIWEAQRNVSRSQAADEILQRWPATPERVQAALREATMPPKVQVSTAVQDGLERLLVGYRGQVPLAPYRHWALRVNQFVEQIGQLPEHARDGAFESFRERLTEELGEKRKKGGTILE